MTAACQRMERPEWGSVIGLALYGHCTPTATTCNTDRAATRLRQAWVNRYWTM